MATGTLVQPAARPAPTWGHSGGTSQVLKSRRAGRVFEATVQLPAAWWASKTRPTLQAAEKARIPRKIGENGTRRLVGRGRTVQIRLTDFAMLFTVRENHVNRSAPFRTAQRRA